MKALIYAVFNPSSGVKPLVSWWAGSGQRILATAVVLAVVLQVIPLAPSPPSQVVTTLLAEAPPPLNSRAPYLADALAPFDSVAPLFTTAPAPAIAAGAEITKTAPSEVDQGGIIAYTLAISQSTGSDWPAGTVYVTDTIPANTGSAFGAPAPGWAYGTMGGVPFFINIFNPVAQGTWITAGVLSVQANKPLPDGTIISNTDYAVSATVRATGSPVTTEVRAPAFSINKTASSSPVCAGSLLTYTLSVSNVGRVTTVEPFTISDVVPSNVSFVSASDGGSYDLATQAVTWTDNTPLPKSGGTTIMRTFMVSVPYTLADGTPVQNITYTVFSNANEVTPAGVGPASVVTVNKVMPGFSVSSPVCVSYPATFTNTSAGASIYEWDFGDGITSTQQQPTHTFTSTGSYTVWLTATSGIGCGSDFTSTVVTVNPLPQASFSAAPNPICADGTVSFTNTSTNTVTYQWDFGDGSPITTTANPSHVFTNPTASPITRTVTLTATGICGTDVTTDTITVNPLPAVSFTSNSPVCLGQTAVFTNNGDLGTYEWDLGDGSPITTSRDVTHTYATTGTFTVWLTTTLGSGCWDTYSDTATVEPGTVAGFTPVSSTICTGSAVAFTNTSSGVGLSYEWDFDDGFTSTAISPTHVFTNPGTEPITRTVVLTTTGACGTSVATGTVVVKPGTVADFTPANSTICTGDAVAFNNTSTGVDLSYQWDLGDGFTSMAISPTHVYTNPGTVPVTRTVILTATGGCGTDVTTGTVVVNPSTVAGFTPASTTICSGSAVTFTNTSTGVGLSCEWDFGDGFASTAISPTHVFTNPSTVAVTRTVILTVTGSCGTDVTTGTVVVNPGTVAGFAPASTIVCPGDVVNFTNMSTGLGLSYEWDLGDGSPITTTFSPSHIFTTPGTVPVTLTVTLTATGVCGTDVTTGTVVVNPDTVAGFTPASTTVCTGDAVNFGNTSTGVGLSYQWDWGDGSPITTTATPSHVFTNAGTVPVTRTVTLTATGACGTDVTTGTVVVNPGTVAGFSASTHSVCANGTVFFSNASTGVGLSYEWDFGDGSPTVTDTNPTHVFTSTSVVTLTATGTCGTDVFTDTVTVSPLPTPTLQINPATAMVCSTVYFTDTDTSNVVTRTWDFGDGEITTTITMSTTSHSYAVPIGNYTVTLTSTTASGCFNTTQEMVTLTVGLPASITLTADPPALPIGQTSLLTATVTDCGGNPVADGTVITFTSSPGWSGVSPMTGTTSNGVATSTVIGAFPGGAATVTATAPTLVWMTTTVEFGAPELAISKEVQPSTVVSSDTITYTLFYTNVGLAPAQDVCLTDTLPVGVSYGGWVGENPNRFGSPTYGSGPPETVTWCTSTLASGAYGTIVITATVDPTDVVSAIFTNTAEITTATPESDTGNNMNQASNQLSQTADVVISKAVTLVTILHPNDVLTYTLTFTNVGYATAAGVIITDVYQPVSLTNVTSSYSPIVTPGPATPPPYTWTVLSLGPGEGGVITITAQVDSGQPWPPTPTTLTNTAFITTTTPDGNASNDSDQETSTVLPGPPQTVNYVVAMSTLPRCGTTAVTATVTDQWGNPVQDGTVVSLTNSAPVLTFQESGSSTYYPTTVNGAVTATLAVDDSADPSWPYWTWADAGTVGSGMKPIDVTDDIVLTSISVTATPDTLPADGSSTSVVAAQVTHCGGAAEGVVVTFTISPAYGTFPITPYTATTDASGIATATLTAGTITGTATVTVTAGSPSDATPVTFTAVPAGGGSVYLPIVMKNWDGTIPPSPTGDLIVTNLAFNPAPPVVGQTYHVTVTIQNSSTMWVTNDFWVDLYLNPPVAPTVNDIWCVYCPGGCGQPPGTCYGAAWRVTTDLGPGATLDLNTSQIVGDTDYSNWPPPTYDASHSPFYAQVDSWGFGYGSVYETDETNNVHCWNADGSICLSMSAASMGAVAPGSWPSGSWEPRPTLPPRSKQPVMLTTPTPMPTLPAVTPSLRTSMPTPSPTPVPTATPSAIPESEMTDTPTATPSPVPPPMATALPAATTTPALTPVPMPSLPPVPAVTPSATLEPGALDMSTPASLPVASTARLIDTSPIIW